MTDLAVVGLCILTLLLSGLCLYLYIQVSRLTPDTEGDDTTADSLADSTVVPVAKSKNEDLLLQVNLAKYSTLHQLGSGVAHEINNPLSVILGRAQMMRLRVEQGSAKSEDLHQAFHKIEEMVKRISRIVSSLQLITKDSALEREDRIYVNALLEDIEALWGERLRHRGYQFDIIRPSEMMVIFGHRSLLITALFNLITNSFEALSQEPQKSIVIAAIPKDTHVEFSVTDSGPGISADKRDSLFKPMNSHAQGLGGASLGLAVVRNIAELHKGTIALDTSSKQTRFVLSLPIWKDGMQTTDSHRLTVID